MNMQDNTQNNWRGLLENADHFPNETLHNKNEAWEKLYARLHNKPRYKLASWYWVAAICLLAVTITVLLVMNKQKNQPLVINHPSPVNNPVPAIAKKSIEENNRKLVPIPKQQEQLVSNPRLKKNTTAVKIESTLSSLVLDSTINSSPAKIAVTSNPHFDSSIIAPITAVTAKKKLRVVHINEMGQPVEESTANKSIERHGFEFRIINNEVYNPSAPANNGLILFKSRTTSN